VREFASLGEAKERHCAAFFRRSAARLSALGESADEKAQRVVAEEMKRLGWREEILAKHRKGDRRK
jgi:hypothetical protein